MQSVNSIHSLINRWQQFCSDHQGPQPPPYPHADVTIKRLIEDSRLVEAGDCFVARHRQGYSDGHQFIPQAIANGASLVIAQANIELPPLPEDGPPIWLVPDSAVVLSWLAGALYDFPGQAMTVIGVTGTDGKTSIANMIYNMLTVAGHKTGLISTINAIIGDTEESTGLHISTPQAPQVQALLRRMVTAGCSHCVLESTSFGLLEHRADAAMFDVAVISNVTHAHLDYHKTWDNYMAAKARLFELARSFAVANVDDKSFANVQQAAQAPLISYGLVKAASVTAQDVRFSAESTTFTLISANESIPITTELVGKFNVYNLLAAGSVGIGLGLAAADIKRGLEATKAISGRMERIDQGQTFLTIVDFAHTPNALDRAIEAARGMTEGKIITVFGSAGRRDVEKRSLMAAISAEKADLTILTAEDPRQESLADILQTMAEGCLAQGGIEEQTFWRMADRGRAIRLALSLATENDLVLICGKGHEQSMCFGSTEYPWDDRTATRKIIDAYLVGKPTPDLGLPTY